MFHWFWKRWLAIDSLGSCLERLGPTSDHRSNWIRWWWVGYRQVRRVGWTPLSTGIGLMVGMVYFSGTILLWYWLLCRLHPSLIIRHHNSCSYLLHKMGYMPYKNWLCECLDSAFSHVYVFWLFLFFFFFSHVNSNLTWIHCSRTVWYCSCTI